MPSTQKGLVTGLSVCDRDSVVICTWSTLISTHLCCDVARVPRQWDRMGRDDSRRRNEYVQLLIRLLSIKCGPCRNDPDPQTCREESVNVHENICVRVLERGEWRGSVGDALLMAVREDMYVVRSHISFPGSVCSDCAFRKDCLDVCVCVCPVYACVLTHAARSSPAGVSLDFDGSSLSV